MPNWVRNIVKMRGIGSLPLYSEYDEEEQKLGNVGEYFDFQKLIPMPEALNLKAGSMESVAMEAAIRRIASAKGVYRFLEARSSCASKGESIEERAKRNGMTLEEAEELGLKYLENAFRYGHATWYGWRIENWGTKWNSAGLQRVDDDTIIFDTAWSNPEPIINALSAQYPDRMIEHWWADEDAGANTGYRCVQDGCVGDDMEPPDFGPYALEIYVKCWGMDERLERDESGNLYII